MGKRQKKKQARINRSIQYSQRANASKPAVASPASAMTPVPLSSGGVSTDDSTCGSTVLKDEATSCCQHVESGVNLDKLRTQFASKLPECHECTRVPRLKDNKGRHTKVAAKKALWICLACGHAGCCSHISEAKDANHNVGCLIGVSHARTHSNQRNHPVVMQWGESLDCWCLLCNLQLKYSNGPAGDSGVVDESINGASKTELLQRAATLLQECKSRQSSTSKVDEVEAGQVTEVKGETPTPPSKPTVEVAPVSPLATRRVMKGLANLGNTCFFNSVMQNLVGVRMLREHFSKEASGQEGVLKLALRKFFLEMDPSPIEKADGVGGSIRTRSFVNGTVGNAVSPRGLFSAICTKAPRFKGFQQQDSHELLRCLLDGLHMEDESIRKAQSGMDKRVGSVAVSNVKEEEADPEKPTKLPDTFVEHMFGGQFSSTVSCRECGHSSVVYEPFLDLSLPIPSKQSFGKVAPIGAQLLKLIAQRSQKGNSSDNGVLILEPAGCSPFDNIPTAIEDPKGSEKAPVLGCSLEPIFGAGGAMTCETSHGHDSGSGAEQRRSSTGEKDHVGQGVDAPVTPLPCEIIPEAVACSSETESTDKSDGWLAFVDEPIKGTEEESAGTLLMDDQRIDLDTLATVSGAPDVSQSRDVATSSQEEPSIKREEGMDDSTLGDVVFQAEKSMDNGYQMEEGAPEYGPLQLVKADDRTENTNECLAMVLVMPSNPSSEVEGQNVASCSDKTSAGAQASIKQESTSTSHSKLEPILPVKLPSGGSEEGDYDGIGGLFDGDDNDTASGYNFGIQSYESGAFNNVDSIITAPAFSSARSEVNLGQASGSVSGGHEVDAYPTMSLEGCLQAFTKTEILSGENAWACENCTRIAHGQREPEQPDVLEGEQEMDCSEGLPQIETHSSNIGPTLVSNNVEGDAMQGEWESLGLEDRGASLEDLSTSTNSMSMVVVSQATDGSIETLDQQNNGDMVEYRSKDIFGQLDVKKNGDKMVDSRAGLNSAEVSIVHDTEVSQPSNSHKEKEVAEEPYVMVEVSSANRGEIEDDTASCTGRNAVSSAKRAHSPDKKRNGKASAKGGLQLGASMPRKASRAKKQEIDPPKMVTVKRDATKRFLISKAPLVLTVHLKRFAQDMHGRLSKLGGHITFHEQLDLSPFIDQRDSTKRDGVYQLIGTVEHSGTMRGGHYVAYVKGSDNESQDSGEGASTWYYISDSHVRKTCLESVLQSEAYLLFYERQTFE